jgi:AAA+ ATPase superfamily predicted ATPase
VDANFHADYLQEVCLAFEKTMKELIDNAASKLVYDIVPPLIEEVIQHWTVARDTCRDFVGREDVLEVINSYIMSTDNKPLVLHGESGSGKTAVMARASAQV